MQNLLKNLNSKIPVSSDLTTAMKEFFIRKEFQKKELLLQEDTNARRLYYLEKGTVRTFYHHNEKEITSWFYHEDQFLTSWFSFYKQKPSFENIQVLEDSIIYSIDYFSFQKLINEFPKFERFARLLAEEQTAGIDQFSKGFLFMSAKEKYELLLSIFPDIALRVNLGYIASFLGITQETLSRIRKKS